MRHPDGRYLQSGCRAGSVSASAAKLLARLPQKPPSTPIKPQMAAPRQPLRPRNVDDAARTPVKDTTPQKLRARHETDDERLRDADDDKTDERLPQKRIKLLPKKRIRMLPARDEKWTAPLHSPERDRPPDLEASMDGSIVMALATPTQSSPVVEEAPTEPPPASMGAVAKLGSLAALAKVLRKPFDAATQHVFDLYNRTWRDFDASGRAPPAKPGADLSADEVRRLRGGLAVPIVLAPALAVKPPPAPPRKFRLKSLLKVFRWKKSSRIAPAPAPNT